MSVNPERLSDKKYADVRGWRYGPVSDTELAANIGRALTGWSLLEGAANLAVASALGTNAVAVGAMLSAIDGAEVRISVSEIAVRHSRMASELRRLVLAALKQMRSLKRHRNRFAHQPIATCSELKDCVLVVDERDGDSHTLILARAVQDFHDNAGDLFTWSLDSQPTPLRWSRNDILVYRRQDIEGLVTGILQTTKAMRHLSSLLTPSGLPQFHARYLDELRTMFP